MISFFQYFKGYYKILIKGSGKERFLNLCSNKKILIWKLKRKQDEYEFCVSRKAYQNLLELKEKTNITLEIKGEYGLPFFLYRYKKRSFFFWGMVWCALFIYVLSLFVWDIQIQGTKQYTENEINKYLEEKGIHTGILKKEISCSALEENIREDFTETAWVSCDLEGTCLTIHLKESIDLSDLEEQKDDIPNDIIASKSGTITSIITRNGTPLVKKGDEVKKGDTLISGIIYLYNEYDELLETNLLSADGDIFAKTVHSFQEEFPLTYYEKEYTGNITKQYTFYVGENGLSIPVMNFNYKNFDELSETIPFRIGSSFYLPFYLHITKYQEYQPKQVTLTKAMAKEKANEKIDYYINGLLKEGKEISYKNFGIDVNEETCKITGNVTTIESIGKIRNIP